MFKIIQTPLTSLLRMRTPIVCPPMAGAGGGALAAQVSLGGGFGFTPAGYDTPEVLQSQITLARSMLPASNTDTPLPIGVGYLGWQLDAQDPTAARALLQAAVDNHVGAVWFAFGDDLGHWIREFQKLDHMKKKSKQTGKTLIFAQVNSVDEAKRAIEEWKVDVVVAQGIESGGHGSSEAPPLNTLISSIISSFDSFPRSLAASARKTPIIAAGGLSTGHSIAPLLTQGAAGAVVGTRFLLASESFYTPAQRAALIAAKGTDTVRTMSFDEARGTTGWPKNVDGRGLRNKTVDDYKNIPLTELSRKFQEGVKNSDPDRMLVWAGTGVGSMNKVQTAKEIVEELHRECLESMGDKKAT